MTSVVLWAGPAGCETPRSVHWQAPTELVCRPMNGEDNRTWYYTHLADPEPGGALERLAAIAGVPEPSSIGLAGFSAFHGLANELLKAPGSIEGVAGVHLADACFLGTRATEPHMGFAKFAELAAKGERCMVATTSGEPGEVFSYVVDGRRRRHASGYDSFKHTWDWALEHTGVEPEPAEVPAGIPSPVRATRAGQLFWLDYRNTISHAEHATVVAAPLMDVHLAPWLAGKRPAASPEPPAISWQAWAALAFASAAVYAAWRYL